MRAQNSSGWLLFEFIGRSSCRTSIKSLLSISPRYVCVCVQLNVHAISEMQLFGFNLLCIFISLVFSVFITTKSIFIILILIILILDNQFVTLVLCGFSCCCCFYSITSISLKSLIHIFRAQLVFDFEYRLFKLLIE